MGLTFEFLSRVPSGCAAAGCSLGLRSWVCSTVCRCSVSMRGLSFISFSHSFNSGTCMQTFFYYYSHISQCKRTAKVAVLCTERQRAAPWRFGAGSVARSGVEWCPTHSVFVLHLSVQWTTQRSPTFGWLPSCGPLYWGTAGCSLALRCWVRSTVCR